MFGPVAMGTKYELESFIQAPDPMETVGDPLHEQRHYLTHYLLLVVGRWRGVHGLGLSLRSGVGCH